MKPATFLTSHGTSLGAWIEHRDLISLGFSPNRNSMTSSTNGKRNYRNTLTQLGSRHHISYFSGLWNRYLRCSQWLNWDIYRMRYHTLVINLCCDDFDTNASFRGANFIPMQSPTSSRFNVAERALSSARNIAALAQLQRTEFGIEYAHQFFMYAINLALFTMLEQTSFDILDSDFLSLTSTFSAIASRSPVGSRLFNLFRSSVETRNQGLRLQQSQTVPPRIKELFEQDTQLESLDNWDYYLTGRASGEKSHLGYGYDSQIPPASGLHDMLEKYERLSIGKEVRPCGQYQHAGGWQTA